jgi:ribosomal protein S18 acetylase RimI-like enzyme
MKIRRAVMSDLGPIRELNAELFRLESLHDDSLDMRWPMDARGEEYFAERIEGPDHAVFVAEHEGSIVGYIAGGMIKPETWRNVTRMAEVGDICVAEDCRGQGVGSKLLHAFFTWCEEHDVQRVSLEASVPNEDAIRLYERLGFHKYSLTMEKSFDQ